MHKSSIGLALAVALLGASSGTMAADLYWDGDTSDDMYLPANWVGDPTPADDDVVHFGGGLAPGASVTPTVTIAGRWFSAVFESDAPTYTYSGNGLRFELYKPGGDAVVNHSANYQVINAGGGRFDDIGWLNAAGGDIVVNAPMYVSSGSSNGSLWSGVSGSHNVYFNVDTSIHPAGDVNGGAWASSTTSNMWNRVRGRFFMTNFSGTAYMGDIGTGYRGSFHLDSVANGAMRLTNDHSLGSAATGSTGAAVYIYGGETGNATLELVNDISVNRYVFYLDGRSGAVADDPHILNVSGNNTLTVGADWNTGYRLDVNTTSESGAVQTAHAGNWNFQSDSGKLTIAGGKIYNTENVAINMQLMGAGDGQIDAPITYYQDNPSVNLVKKGSGTWTLTNANNDFAGTMTIEAGTLAVTGNLTGGGAVTVMGGGRLAGTGSIASTVTVEGKLAPGMSPGTLSVAALVLSGASLEYQLDALAHEVGGGVNDLTIVGGDLDLSGGATLEVEVLNGATLSPGTYELIQYTTLVGGDESSITLGSIAVPDGERAYLQIDGNSVNLVVTPEPATLSLLAVSALLMARRRRS